MEKIQITDDTAEDSKKRTSPDDAADEEPEAKKIAVDKDGDASVELTVTWRGAVTVPGLPPVDISPLVYSAPAAFDVREARTQLVAGDR